MQAPSLAGGAWRHAWHGLPIRSIGCIACSIVLRAPAMAASEGESLDHAGSIKESYLFRQDLHASVGADAVYGRSIRESYSLP